MSLFDYLNLDEEKVKEEVLQSNLQATLKSAIILTLQEYMEKERDEHIQASRYERNHERQDYRNGYLPERDIITSVGPIKLRVPRTRSGEFSTSLFEKYSRFEQSFVLSMLEMVVNGVSTRKVANVVETLCGERVSKSFVSSLVEKLDPVVDAWAERKLDEFYHYIHMDAMYIKVREDKKVVSKAVYIATAIGVENRREVIGFRIDEQENYAAWKAFIGDLMNRGLKKTNMVISDAHIGLREAIKKSFLDTPWQRCSVHFKRNLFDQIPKKDNHVFKQEIKRLYRSNSIEEARSIKEYIVDTFSEDKKYEKALRLLEDGFDDSTQYLHQGLEYRRYITSTNHLERLNQEVRRRERVIRIFPNKKSAFRLIGAALFEYTEAQTLKRKLSVEKS